MLYASAVASALSGAPSTAYAMATTRSRTATTDYVRDATTRIGVLMPPFRPGFARGAAAHVVISALAGEALGRALPRRHSVGWGAVAGLLMGVVNVGVIGRRIPAIAELPLAPQLADNVAFGMIFALVADHSRSHRI